MAGWALPAPHERAGRRSAVEANPGCSRLDHIICLPNVRNGLAKAGQSAWFELQDYPSLHTSNQSRNYAFSHPQLFHSFISAPQCKCCSCPHLSAPMWVVWLAGGWLNPVLSLPIKLVLWHLKYLPAGISRGKEAGDTR